MLNYDGTNCKVGVREFKEIKEKQNVTMSRCHKGVYGSDKSDKWHGCVLFVKEIKEIKEFKDKRKKSLNSLNSLNSLYLVSRVGLPKAS